MFSNRIIFAAVLLGCLLSGVAEAADMVRIGYQKYGTLLLLKERTALLVTHDVVAAVTLADRILVLKDGVLAEDLMLPPRPDREIAALTDDLLTSL